MKTAFQGLLLLTAGLQLSWPKPRSPAVGAPGTCGSTNTNAELVVSLSPGDYASGASCGREIEVSANGASFVAKVVGDCPGCGTHDIDLSPAAFQVLAPLSAGLVSLVVWNFV